MKPEFICEAVVIGASAGGIGALFQILPQLPKDFPVPIFIVIHLPPDNSVFIPDLFTPKCQITVKEAEDKEPARPGTVYFAPPDYHLLVESNGSLSLSSEEPELFSRPAINLLFDSAADAYGSGLLGIILTGASTDGAHGVQAILNAGGTVLVQDPKTAEASTMPEAALEVCPTAQTLAPKEIGALLSKLRENAPTNA